jgi:hypothetical protein
MRPSKKKRETAFEENLKEIRSFLELWLQFHKAYKRAYRGEDISREDEAEFLKMKSTLARRHAMLVQRLGDDYIGVEPIRPLLSETVTLRHMGKLRPEHYERIERAWHYTYIRLNESIGHLRYLVDEG